MVRLLALILFINNCFAQTQDLETAYKRTVSLCMDPRTEDVLDIARTSAKESFEKFHFFKISTDLEELIQSSGYHQALNVCYGSNETKKGLFTAALLLQDRVGKTAGLVAFFGPLKIFKSVSGFLKARSLGAYVAFHSFFWGYIAGEVKGAFNQVKAQEEAFLDSDPLARKIHNQIERGEITKEEGQRRYSNAVIDRSFQQMNDAAREINRQAIEKIDFKIKRCWELINNPETSYEKMDKLYKLLDKLEAAKKDLQSQEIIE